MTLQQFAEVDTTVLFRYRTDVGRREVLRLLAGIPKPHRTFIQSDRPGLLTGVGEGEMTVRWLYGPVHGAWPSDVSSAVNRLSRKMRLNKEFEFEVVGDAARTRLRCPEHGEDCAAAKQSELHQAERTAVSAFVRRKAVNPSMSDADLKDIADEVGAYLERFAS